MTDTNQQDENGDKRYTFFQRQAMRMARWPKTHFWVAFAIAFGLSFVGLAFGDFSVSTEGGGWQSRGTLIANREMQMMLVNENLDTLFSGDESAWEDLTTNVQIFDEEYLEDNRRLTESTDANQAVINAKKNTMYKRRRHSTHSKDGLTPFFERRLQQEATGALDGCDIKWYTDGRMTNGTSLWPVWKVKETGGTALEPEIIEELCEAEEATQRVLEEKGLCFGCESSDTRKCLPPHGLVLYARLVVPNGLAMDCTDLAKAWAPFQVEAEAEFDACIKYIEANPFLTEAELPTDCTEKFHASLVDEFFDTTGYVEYTSSIFATTPEMVDDLYKITDDFHKGGKLIEGTYDTHNEDFVNLLAENAVGTDMLLATGSALVTAVAIIVHTRSIFLTVVGLIQITLSFPLAYFVYHFIGGFEFFPFLNFIGVFVVFALGADHVFVAVDKWKNARLDHPNGTTEQVAAKALPEAASAMMLTTSTTAAAFFGTAICPVAPVRLFAIFCGLLIMFDYILDVALMFPCLCIYDSYRNNNNCCVTCQRRHSDEVEPGEMRLEDASHSNGEAKPFRSSVIGRILLGYHNFIFKIRWPLLAACALTFSICCYYASTLALPNSSDVRVLRSSVEFERNYEWRINLLFEALDKKSGSQAYTIWGVVPSDTGDHSNPESWTTLELDGSFDPSTEVAQLYLRGYCPRFFEQEFATKPVSDYECAINRFESWLQEQSLALSEDSSTAAVYETHCAGSSALPMPSESFHACFSAWSQLVEEKTVLSRNGVVEILYFPFRSRVRFDSSNKDLESEWNLIENWMNAETTGDETPTEVSKAYFSSPDFWWYDTNSEMFVTAYGSAAIALAAAAIVILLSSRSLVMTLFSVLSIGYVLASVTAMMVAAGWDLGFLESICFAILIGVSVDFVIHFSHAYVALEGDTSRERRTRHALVDMGPSILAAAFTTLAGALVMLFCVITFFTKFAFVLFFAIIQATIGSFVVFLTLTNCFGPREPTKMADRLVAKCLPCTVASPSTLKQQNSTTDDDQMTNSARSAIPY